MAEVVVVGCGILTPVGLSAAEAAASARSRTARMTEIDWLDGNYQPFIVGAVPDDALPDLAEALAQPPLQYREDRMLRLADVALREAWKPLAALKAPPQLALLLGLPELQTTVPVQGSEFLERLHKQTGLDFDRKASVPLPRGRASGLLAVKEARQRIADGKCDFCLAGGVDSHIDLYVMGTLDMEQRVRTDVNADGFAPAEGAGFVLLASAPAAQKQGLTALARVVAGAEGDEPGHIYSDQPYKGEGLAQTFAALLAEASGEPKVGCVYASFNGERYWAKECGIALLRHKDRLEDPYQMEHPAECFGDLGAAHGVVMLALACLGVKNGYRRSPALVYASSDHGARAAVLLAKG